MGARLVVVKVLVLGATYRTMAASDICVCVCVCVCVGGGEERWESQISTGLDSLKGGGCKGCWGLRNVMVDKIIHSVPHVRPECYKV